MHYASNEELPPFVREGLPENAKDIFRRAFNRAYEAHRGEPRREDVAFRIAWEAVELEYRKVGQVWVSRVGPLPDL